MIKTLEVCEKVGKHSLILGAQVDRKGWYNIYFEFNGRDYWDEDNQPSSPREAVKITLTGLRMFEELKGILKANGITKLSVFMVDSDQFADKRNKFYNSKAVGFVKNKMILK